MNEKQQALIDYFNKIQSCAIAVSGGVDSMLLAFIAHKFTSTHVTVFHACSPAVPKAAYQRLLQFSKEKNWNLVCLNAKELEDENYTANPLNRCFFCKTHLFSHIAKQTTSPICSGTNLDDITDFRPGLQAAKNYNVLQPYVDVGFTKKDIYQLAAQLDLTELKSLPAQPCLASRVETGIAISSDDLLFIDNMERTVAQQLSPAETVRCRITAQGVYIELGSAYESFKLQNIKDDIQALCSKNNKIFSGFRRYKKGAAFLKGAAQ